MKGRGRRHPEQRLQGAIKPVGPDGARAEALTRTELELPDGRYLLAYARAARAESDA